MAQALAEEDTIRILVSTDNHVGYAERDPIRKDDSWRTFDEVMQIAKTEDVDMVLLGGDLFHDNKPSRKSMYQVIQSLRKNCLGMKPCELEFLSDPQEVFGGSTDCVNYQDPDINISIPVFSIHGNHDDPSGDGHYCSLDLLQAAGLVNYFGRVPEADNIRVKPVLLQKGETKLALYGLSNVRDERMHRTFRDNRVHFYRPGQQKNDFFNLLTLHQNHYAHTPTSYVSENMLPEFLDLVIWGHEHECLVDPIKNDITNFHVIQPGSSIATSLVEGEAVTKQVAILNITGKRFTVDKIPLRTVRPFVTREIVLASDKRFKGLEKKQDNRQEVTKRLMTIVEEMIQEAHAMWESTHGGNATGDEQAPLPLIRLKVEYTAPEGSKFDVENPQRFSNRFANRVANQNDVVYFYRKKTSVMRKIPNDSKELREGVAEALESVDTIKVDTLVQEYFAQQSLKILPQAPFGDAVNQFVNKDDKHAVEMFLLESLSTQVKGLLQLDDDKVTDDLEAQIEEYRKVMEKDFVIGQKKQAQRRRTFKPRPDNWDSDMDGHWHAQPQALEEVAKSPPPAASKSRGSARPASGVVFSDEDEEMLEEVVAAQLKRGARGRKTAAAPAKKAAPVKKVAATKKAPARGRKKPNPFEDSDEEEEDVIMEDDDFEPPPPPTRATRGAAKSTRQTTLNFASQSQRSTKATQKAIEISDDEISEDDDAFETMPTKRAKRR
ncbi:putative double-strand break repair protein mus-23 [Triangularia verruculosa]|uniref:Double-strand break repair protein n=1 Tax=Triangularia verruculosa TaxID=2587418 RepID=A0AAN6XJ07_9PEZI|nr:putative double-strand break repair protein mus-23 [Triangularia verruculosa]